MGLDAPSDPETAIEYCAEFDAGHEKPASEMRGFARKLRTRHSRNVEVLVAVARMYLRYGELIDAQATLTQLIRLSPFQSDVYQLLGLTLLRMGDAHRAAVAFEQAIEHGDEAEETQRHRRMAEDLVATQSDLGDEIVAIRVSSMLGIDAPSIGGRVRATPPEGLGLDELGAVDPSWDEPLAADEEGEGFGASLSEPAPKPSTVPPVASRRKLSTKPNRRATEPPPTVRAVSQPDGWDGPADDDEDFVGSRRPSERPTVMGPPPDNLLGPPSRTQYSLLPGRSGDDEPSERPRRTTLKGLSADGLPLGPDASSDELTAIPRAPALPNLGGDGNELDRQKSTPPEGSQRSSRPPPQSRASSAPPARRSSVPPSRHHSSHPPAPAEREPGPDSNIRRLSPAPASARPSRPSVDTGAMGRRLWIAGGAAAIAAGGLVLWLSRDNKPSDDSTLPQLNEMVLRGDRASLREAEAAVDASLRSDQRATGAHALLLRIRTLRVLDHDDDAEGLLNVIGDARAAGLSEEDLSFAVLAAELDNPATELRDALEKAIAMGVSDPDGYYHLVFGEAHARLGLPKCVEHFQAAVDVAPNLVSARARLVLVNLLGGATELSDQIDQLAAVPGAEPLLAWIRVLDARGGEAANYHRLVQEAHRAADGLGGPFGSLGDALYALGQSDPSGRRAALASAIGDARWPSVIAFIGELALGAGDVDSALYATKQIEQVSGDRKAHLSLAASVDMARGRFSKVRAALPALPSNARAKLGAMLAYESLDHEGLLEAAKQVNKADRASIDMAVARLSAESPPPRSELLALRHRDPIWGSLVAVDIAMDLGDLELSDELTRDWMRDPTPVQALRLARLSRYHRDSEEARAMLRKSAESEGKIFESLLLSRTESQREAIFFDAVPDNRPQRRWMEVLRLAMDKQFGRAFALVTELGEPSADAGLPVRLTAALTYAALSDKVRAKRILRPLIDTLPQHPDVVLAAVQSSILPPTSLRK